MDTFVSNFPLSDVWMETLGDPGVRVAVLDGPVDVNHPCLAGAHLSIPNQDETVVGNNAASIHGTHITSIIFGQHRGAIKGIAPQCSGIIIPIFSDINASVTPTCSQTVLAQAINAAREAGAHIINISAGEVAHDSAVEPVLQQAIQVCSESGVILVAAAGNEYNEVGVHIPAALPNVIAVGMSEVRLGEDLVINRVEGYGGRYLLAPGKDILGAIPGGSIDYISGSSCSAAMVSGLLALILSIQLKQQQELDPQLARKIVLEASNGAGINFGFMLRRIRQLGQAAPETLKRNVVAWEHIGKPPIDAGQWCIKEAILQDKYNIDSTEKIGQTRVIVNDGLAYTITDLQYENSTENGIILIPVSDDYPIVLAGGQIVSGSQLVDGFLREAMQLGDDGQIFALLSYIDASENKVKFNELVEKKIKHGHRHVGVYIGNGVTTHGLPPDHDWEGDDFLNMKWNARRSPINVQIISLKGVEQTVLNQNAKLVDTILSASVKVPLETDTLDCRTVDLNTTLQFYRDTLLDKDYLHEFAWYTNCSNIKTIVINTFVNLPHNPDAFREVFGEAGVAVWHAFKNQYERITGRAFGPEDETEFVPLWKLEGLSANQINPLSVREYNAYEAACTENRSDEYSGRRPLAPGLGMAWTLETPIDLIIEFFRTYVDLRSLNGRQIIALLLYLKNHINRKTDIPEGLYLNLIAPLVEKLFTMELAFDVSNGKNVNEGSNLAEKEEKFLGELLGHFNEPHIKELIHLSYQKAKSAIANDESVDSDESDSKDFEKLILKEVSKIKKAYSANKRVKYFASPSIFHRLASGSHPHSKFVKVTSLCTLLDYQELEQLPAAGQAEPISMEGCNLQSIVTNIDYRNTNQKGDNMTSDNFSPVDATKCNASIQPCQETTAAAPETDNKDYLVYAFGRIGYRFASNARRDSYQYQMEERDPGDANALLDYLEKNPHDAVGVQWTLNLDNTPIYVIEPQGPYAREAYELLRKFLYEQTNENVERVSIPGYIIGVSELSNGVGVPIVAPELRGMCNWTTKALVNAVVGDVPEDRVGDKLKLYESKKQGVKNFLERVYYEMRNLGKQPRDRAINYAATNAFQVEQVYEKALQEEMELESIGLEQSPLPRPDSDCWDVKLSFFYPKHESRSGRKVFRFTVDVADVVPVVIGPMRVWSTPQ